MADANYNGIPDDIEAIIELFKIMLVAAILGAIVARFTGITDIISIGGTSLSAMWELFVSQYLPLIRLMSVALSVALIVFVVYITRENNKIIAAERARVNAGIDEDLVARASDAKPEETDVGFIQNKRWKSVIELINSENARDWKLAILEADILLGELLDTLGYRGESIGEQLKAADRSDFLTLDKAWEAHKIRNSIAHEGEDFLITHREAQRIIRLYEDVFLEFEYV